MPLPHITNIEPGRNRWDAMGSAVFRMEFELPQLVQSALNAQDKGSDISLLPQHITNISGLDALQKTVQAGSQKFLGADVSFLNPALDNTYIELTVTFNLNLRHVNDAYLLRIFKLWAKLGYDLQTGMRTLKAEYVAPTVTLLEANRNGVIWREVILKDVLLTGITGIDTDDYTANEARQIQCTFRSDYWDEVLGSGIEQGSDTEITNNGWTGSEMGNVISPNLVELNNYPFQEAYPYP